MALPYGIHIASRIADHVLNRDLSPNQDLYYRSFEEYFNSIISTDMDTTLANTVRNWADADGLDMLAWYYRTRPAEWNTPAMINKFRALLSLLYRASIEGPTTSIIFSILRLFDDGGTVTRLDNLPMYSSTATSSFWDGSAYPTAEPIILSEDSAFKLKSTETEYLVLSAKDVIYETSELDIPEYYNRQLLEDVLRLVIPANVRIIFNYKKYLRCYIADKDTLNIWLPELELVTNQPSSLTVGTKTTVAFPATGSVIRKIMHYGAVDVVCWWYYFATQKAACYMVVDGNYYAVPFVGVAGVMPIDDFLVGDSILRFYEDGTIETYRIGTGELTMSQVPFLALVTPDFLNRMILNVSQSIGGGTFMFTTSNRTFFMNSTLYYNIGDYVDVPLYIYQPAILVHDEYLLSPAWSSGGSPTMTFTKSEFNFLTHTVATSSNSIPIPTATYGTIQGVKSYDLRTFLMFGIQATSGGYDITTYSINGAFPIVPQTPVTLFTTSHAPGAFMPTGYQNGAFILPNHLVLSNWGSASAIEIVHNYDDNATRTVVTALSDIAGSANIIEAVEQ